jgi:hypothetical protein
VTGLPYDSATTDGRFTDPLLHDERSGGNFEVSTSRKFLSCRANRRQSERHASWSLHFVLVGRPFDRDAGVSEPTALQGHRFHVSLIVTYRQLQQPQTMIPPPLDGATNWFVCGSVNEEFCRAASPDGATVVKNVNLAIREGTVAAAITVFRGCQSAGQPRSAGTPS